MHEQLGFSVNLFGQFDLGQLGFSVIVFSQARFLCKELSLLL